MNYPKADHSLIKKAHDFIKKHPMGVLSTVANDKPWGAAIYYVADDDFNFFFVTRAKTEKFKNIDHNPFVSLTIADPETQTTVQASGAISKVPSKDIIDIVFKKLASIRPKDDINWLPPVIKVHQGDWMILKLTPNYAQFAEYQELKSDINDSYIKQIV